MLEAQNLGCIRGDRLLFRHLNFTVPPGAVLELRGANGSGKTSLLRILCGLANAAEGEVRWNGTDIRRVREEYLATIAYVGHQNGIKDELTTLENLLIAGRIGGHEVKPEQGRSALDRVGLSKQDNLPTRFLSAGQRRRLALARLLAARATVWVLDEILASLDDAGMNLARELISAHGKRGGLAIVATHQTLNLSEVSLQEIDLSVLSQTNSAVPPSGDHL